jgi:hypothetical protein
MVDHDYVTPPAQAAVAPAPQEPGFQTHSLSPTRVEYPMD